MGNNFSLHIQKFHKNDLKGLERHNSREFSKSKNEDIKEDKTIDNYDLRRIGEEINYSKDVSKRLEEGYFYVPKNMSKPKEIKDDQVHIVGIVVSANYEFFQGMPLEKEKEFFEKTLEKIEEKFGKENIISAKVHKDEKTPHLHIDLVPLTQEGKLSAKELFNKESLRSLQDIAIDLKKEGFDIERGKSTEEKKKHIDTHVWKEINKIHEVALIENIAFDKQKEVEPLKEKLTEFEKTKEEFSKVKKPMLDLYNFKEQESQYENFKEFSGIGVFKKPTGNVIVSEEHIKELRTLAQQGILLRDENKKLEKTNNFLERRNEELNKQIIDYPKLERENKNLYMAFDRVMTQYILEHNPNDPKDLEKVSKFYEKSLKSALYPMDNEEKRDFCNKISWKINGWDMTKAVQRAYGISTGKIKENSRGNER